MKLFLVGALKDAASVRRYPVNPEQDTENKNMKVQKPDRKHTNLLTEDERRQSARRTSRPTLLSVDEIATLRKK
ncbi:MAG: hypothetical protein MUR51_04040 [Pseudomonadota bacterium]|nr:hypothetical protein [Pseudomonadota bacterium]